MATSDPSDGIQQAVYGFLGVGSKAEDGTADVMTANWGTQVSLDPRMFAISVQEASHTAANIKATGVFSINFMPGDSHDTAVKWARRSESGEGRLAGEQVTYHETGAPVLGMAVGWIECKVIDSSQPGDHIVFFGEVVGGGQGPADGESGTLRSIDMSYGG